MGNAAGSEEVPQGKEGKPVVASMGSKGPTKSPKLPMPPEEELEKRFSDVLVSVWHHAQPCSFSFHT